MIDSLNEFLISLAVNTSKPIKQIEITLPEELYINFQKELINYKVDKHTDIEFSGSKTVVLKTGKKVRIKILD